MVRTLSTPKNPEFFGRVIAALRLLSDGLEPENDGERELLQALAMHTIKPAVAKRMVGTLDAVPMTERSRLLGSIADSPFVFPATTFENPRSRTRGGGHGRADRATDAGASVNPANTGTVGNLDAEVDPWPDRDPSIRYTIRYVGLFCQDETNGPGSDEIYVLTSAFHINDGQNVPSDAVHNPLGYPGGYYGDVDREEHRDGPVTAAWSGNPDTMSLVVVVMEHDQGDPDAYRDEIDVAVKAAIAVATRFYPPAAVLALVEEQIGDLINWLFDTGDDIISTQTVVLERADLERYAGESPTYYMGTKRTISVGGGGAPGTVTTAPLTTKLFQHFVTKHVGDGAEYAIGFDIKRDPALPAPIIL